MKFPLRHIIACISAMLVMAALSVSAQDLSKEESRKKQLEKDITLLDKQIAAVKKQSSSATARLELLRENISKRRALVTESERVIKSYSDSIRIKDQAISTLQNEVDTLVCYYEKLVRSAYKHRDPHVWYLYVFASDDLGQAFRRAAYFRNISGQIRSDAEEIRVKKAELESQKVMLAQLKQEAEVLKAGRVKELEELRKDEQEADNLVKQLQKSRRQIEAQITEKKKEVKNNAKLL
jgi:septal ring factor EnvC (AmiA/AmiB activator)